jgi:hypothetical protein
MSLTGLAHRLQPFYRAAFLPGPYRLFTAGRRALPDFLIIGAMRAGTTSLQQLICSHPQAQPAIRKEIHYFDLNFRRGARWYRAHFPRQPRGSAGFGGARPLSGESSPYYLFHPHAARRAASLLPQVKLIVTLRHPVDRAYSHYWHSVRFGHEMYDFERALAGEDAIVPEEARKMRADEWLRSQAHRHNSYVARGRYAEQLAVWLAYFPRDQFFILENSQFAQDFPRQRARLFEFLGLPDAPVARDREANRANYPPMRPETRARLVEAFRPHNAALFALLGETFDWGD